jgi:hypothetical protein
MDSSRSTSGANTLENNQACMEDDPLQLNTQPADVLQLPGIAPVRVDLPLTWESAECLASPDLETRIKAVSRLMEAHALRQSSLVAYLFATRLNEPDIQLRSRVVAALADVFYLDEQGRETPPEIRASLAHFLAAMRARQIFALLQVAAFDLSAEPWVATLLGYCSFAGGHLADILASRQAALPIRKQAVHFIGRMGYLDAEPGLARQAARLESRANGRGYGEAESDESSLLPLIRQALTVLRSP